MFSNDTRRSRFPLFFGIVFVSLGMSGVFATDRSVGTGKEFATITDALATAVAGEDRVVVFSGTYNEKIDWNTAVDIVEADGETAILTINDNLATDSGSVWIEVTYGGEQSATWDGIDLLYDSVNYSRIVLKRDSVDSQVTLQNMTVRDTDTASGHPGIFAAEAGIMNLRNVDIDVSSVFQASNPNEEGLDFEIGYEFGVLGAGETQLTCENVNCQLTGGAAFKNLGIDTVATWDGGSLNRKTTGMTNFLTDITDGTSVFTGVHFTSGCDTPRGLLTRFGDKDTPVTVELFDCTFNGELGWRAVSFEKTTNARFINCCFPHDVTTMGQNDRDCQVFGEEKCEGAFFCSQSGFINPPFSIHFDRSSGAGGRNWELEFTHCTFAATDSIAPFGPAEALDGLNEASGIQNATIDTRSVVELLVDNCIFSVPGSEVGGVSRKRNRGPGAALEVIASTNIVFTDDTFLVESDHLELDDAGTILNVDPHLGEDFCHIEDTSPAIDAGMNVGVATDIDGEARPIGEGFDLGTDETKASEAPVFLRGDADISGKVDFSDPIHHLTVIFLGEGEILCEDAADSDDSGDDDFSDDIRTLTVLFLGGETIPAPGPEECGPDPTDDGIDCVSYPPTVCP